MRGPCQWKNRLKAHTEGEVNTMVSEAGTVSEEEVEQDVPALRIAGLKVWIRGRAHPDSVGYWDGNWLDIAAVCSYPDSLVRSTGRIIHLREIKRLLQTCENLRA